MKQNGFALVGAIFVLVALGLLGGYMVGLSGVQVGTFNLALQGTRAYQAAHAGTEWAAARINNGGTCTEINAQTAMTFNGLSGFEVHLSCESEAVSEGNQSLTFYRINALSQFGTYTSADYVARELQFSMLR